MPYASKNFNYTDIWVCFDDIYKGPRLKIGQLPNNKVYAFIDELNAFVPQKGNCMQYHFYSVLHSHPFKAKNKMKRNQSLYIVATNGKYVKYLCGAKDNTECLGCIKCGNCKEAFIRECIGKKFFADKYKNNQR
ncbi:MAG: hypothetical protein IKF41_01975 [Alphaproteobacteria bacterium]|nr:hypothetical protein [Alphaproteobacteria bacterium]